METKDNRERNECAKLTDREIEINERPAAEADLICNALVNEIGRTPTWLGVVEAWRALLRVRRMARGLRTEHDLFNKD
ncbi:hypothetical protein LCGC14_2154390 [marine sediment metagenome]|uniref:Uncharacterized protein n=1 Tax=marine sediment metagenome TaxID=412755 RepID=A0A0F9DUT8_9ZZZZ